MSSECEWALSNAPACDRTYAQYVGVGGYDTIRALWAFLVLGLSVSCALQIRNLAAAKGGLWRLLARNGAHATASSRRLRGAFRTQELISLGVCVTAFGLVGTTVDPLGWARDLDRDVMQGFTDWSHALVLCTSYAVVFSWWKTVDAKAAGSAVANRLFQFCCGVTVVTFIVSGQLAVHGGESYWIYFSVKIIFNVVAIMVVFFFALVNGIKIIQVIHSVKDALGHGRETSRRWVDGLKNQESNGSLRQKKLATFATSPDRLRGAPSSQMQERHVDSNDTGLNHAEEVATHMNSDVLKGEQKPSAPALNQVSSVFVESHDQLFSGNQVESTLALGQREHQSPGIVSNPSYESESSLTLQESPMGGSVAPSKGKVRRSVTERVRGPLPPLAARPNSVRLPGLMPMNEETSRPFLQQRQSTGLSVRARPRSPMSLAAGDREARIKKLASVANFSGGSNNSPSSRRLAGKSGRSDDVLLRVIVLIFMFGFLCTLGLAISIVGLSNAIGSKPSSRQRPWPNPSEWAAILHLSPLLIDLIACFILLYFFRKNYSPPSQEIRPRPPILRKRRTKRLHSVVSGAGRMSSARMSGGRMTPRRPRTGVEFKSQETKFEQPHPPVERLPVIPAAADVPPDEDGSPARSVVSVESATSFQNRRKSMKQIMDGMGISRSPSPSPMPSPVPFDDENSEAELSQDSDSIVGDAVAHTEPDVHGRKQSVHFRGHDDTLDPPEMDMIDAPEHLQRRRVSVTIQKEDMQPTLLMPLPPIDTHQSEKTP